VGDGNVAKGTSHCSVFKQKLFSQQKIMAAKGRPVLRLTRNSDSAQPFIPGIAGPRAARNKTDNRPGL
jgi:hypothetical protein